MGKNIRSESGRYVEGLVSGLSVTAAQMVAEGGYEIASLAARFKKETPTKEMESSARRLKRKRNGS